MTYNKKIIISIILRELQKDANIFDLGCGKGKLSLFFARKGYNVISIDKSGKNIFELNQSINKLKLNNIFTIHERIENYNIKANKFDLIICNNVLQFINKENKEKIINRIKNKIKKQGIIYITSFTTQDPSFKDASKSSKLTYFVKNELKKIFSDFKILYYYEGTIKDKAHNGCMKDHKHGIVTIIAQKYVKNNI